MLCLKFYLVDQKSIESLAIQFFLLIYCIFSCIVALAKTLFTIFIYLTYSTGENPITEQKGTI